jgi:hypothetical protein
VIIPLAWDDAVISYWVWQVGNLKSLAWDVRIKRSYKKCDWERGGENQYKIIRITYKIIE